ncbi:MAG: tRNA (adenosine(37)-N6)-threonylcarbamoyltransferase complex dimerization subunit type 1 TsaB [Deltaproteobacteria bacterium]|nr:tRNA (adenosine(37)-N6)-threonylcarbamoyltransferase complex dimerization subunit type 1 TsaB [Deltaproteobacteria bacterium]
MKLLAIETSTMIGSVALTDDNELVAEYQIGIKATYSDTLFPMIDHILKNANVSIQEVDAFALAKGPGSFTSLRIGISVIKGLALANNKPVIAIPSLDALAHNICFSNMLICPLIDARRDEVYTAFYKREEGHTLKKLTPDRAIVPEILLDEIREEVVFLGDGTDLYKDLIIRKLKEKALFSPLHLKYPRASAIAQLAFKKLNVNEVSDIEVMTPLYVRPPEAETKWVKKKIEC